MVSKEILIQYTDLQQEVKELRMQIDNLEKQIARMEKDGSVRDSVKGGSGGIQHFIVEGFPVPAYRYKEDQLRKRRLKLELREMKLLETLDQLEEFVESINDSYIRRIIQLKFILGLTWQQVADRLGGGNTEFGVKKAFYRYMKKL